MTVKIGSRTVGVKLEKQFDAIKLEENKETITLYFREGGVLSIDKSDWKILSINK